MKTDLLDYSSEVQTALQTGQAVVALESTIIAHGLPWPQNLQCAQRLEAIVRSHDAVPATIAVLGGRIKIGLSAAELDYLAQGQQQGKQIAKLSRRDLAIVLARQADGATTVAGTMLCAHLAGIRVFATGGIGGVHRGAEQSFDISADLSELGRTPVAVVCAGAKSILDLPKTLEVLETQGVPVIGYGTDEFPAFYQRSSGLPVDTRVDTPVQAADLIRRQHQLGLQTGLLITVPIPSTAAIADEQAEGWIEQALQDATAQGISGKASTPFLLARIVALSGGQSLQANLALVENNTRIAAQIAVALSQQDS
ncbi:MAG: pseudouridine-5'-phosphate glycosidase [Gammaproteobacteria bacterium]